MHERAEDPEFAAFARPDFRYRLHADLDSGADHAGREPFELGDPRRPHIAHRDERQDDSVDALLHQLMLADPLDAVVRDPLEDLVGMHPSTARQMEEIEHAT